MLEHLIDISAEELGKGDFEELTATGQGENKLGFSLM